MKMIFNKNSIFRFPKPRIFDLLYFECYLLDFIDFNGV